MEDNINKVNEAIEVLKTFCFTQMSCQKCPFEENCGNIPEEWETINTDEVN